MLRHVIAPALLLQVFIGGKFIGGCDDTMALHGAGNLVPALTAAGVKVA